MPTSIDGRSLRALREALKIDRNTLGAALGTTSNGLAHLEGRENLTVKTATRYSAALAKVAKRELNKREALQQQISALIARATKD